MQPLGHFFTSIIMPVRTVYIPVVEVIDGGTKSEFYADLRKSLDMARQVANLAVTTCVKLDDLTQEKMPVNKEKGMSVKNQAYHASKVVLPAGSQAIASNISGPAVSQYMSDRWQVRRGIRSVRNHRSFPWPLTHNASTSSLRLEDRGEFLAARIKLASKWWVVRLAGGSSHRDQIRGLKKAIANESYGDSRIRVDRKHKAILEVACNVPNQERTNLAGAMQVASSRDHLLVASFERSPVPFVINADVCRQWQSEADRRYQRLRQDRKSDANRRRIRDSINAVSAKMQRRMKTLCHECSSRIVQKAVRMKVECINLDLTIKSYTKHFPWCTLESMIRYKAESAGIRVIVQTQTVSAPDVSKPHVYFKYAPIANRVKIGSTVRDDGGRHGAETDSAEELVILAIDNQPKTKVRAREKHWHAYFDSCCDNSRSKVREWFHAEPILAWLREAGWLGNAGNLSQIMQVLDVSQDTILAGHLQADRECPVGTGPIGCSQNAVSGEDIALPKATALAVTQRTFWD